MRVVAVDPGLTTGYAWWSNDAADIPPGILQLTWMQTVAEIEHNIDWTDVIVCESFIPRPGVRSWQPEALYAIGALQYLAEREGRPFVLQSPADAKNFSTNDKLRKLGWYATGVDHAMDATRHVLLYAVRNGLIKPEVLM